ncbi:MAG: tRNA preQ1(34) S-adenosylmethionine ribosyltransferase-isomerase QueA [Hyphomonadaceae bacterium]|nr:tRNA preQ1(34) S-adenosylmethionine ribosyltransferase-isomerase QueA [Hyphomonadaceae bacterium]
MRTELFDFHLPDERIALRPCSPRDHAKLLHVMPRGRFGDWHVYDLPDLLREGDILVLNDTRVLPAALTAIRPPRPVGGGADVPVTINLHKPVNAHAWRAFAKPAKRLRTEDALIFSDKLTARVSDKGDGGDIQLEFSLSDHALTGEINRIGDIPLPPYIVRRRKTDARDVRDYQTVYAREAGSVAAPTAGLHFTPGLLGHLKKRGINIHHLTLHVGAATFLPVKSGNVSDHKMHSEWFTLPAKVAEQISTAKSRGHRIIAVGTTALRALESAAQSGQFKARTGETDIFITPGYQFKIIDGLMTNFHLPRSTLFMLVCALAGRKRMQAAYAHALGNDYRFYSYGDSSLLWKAD